MARFAGGAVALSALVLSLPVGAQPLARLHVRAMTLSASPGRVAAGDLVRLVLTVRVDERTSRLDNVTLPDLSGFDVLGDERRCVPAGRKTTCSETLSLVADGPGTYAVAPATLDAIDAHTGRPTRFGSNAVTIFVAASPATALRGSGRAFEIAWVVAGLMLLVLAAVLGWRGRRRRPRPRIWAGDPVADPPAQQPGDEAQLWARLIEHLRVRPSRARVDAVRAFLRRRVGARPDETFADLAARGVQREEPSAMEALRLVERAAFTDDEHLSAAVHDALAALERVPGARPAVS